MNPLLQTTIFGIALSLTIFFFGSLVSWCVYSIAPKSFYRKFNPKQQHIATCGMIIAIFLWSVQLYLTKTLSAHSMRKRIV